MPTTKSRINISVGKSTRAAIKAIAKREDIPVATAAARLIEEALEIEEDYYLSAIADERLKKPGKWLSHDEVWKHLTK